MLASLNLMCSLVNKMCPAALHNSLMAALWDRIDAELTRRGMGWADLGRKIDATDQTMHNWKTRGSIPASRHKAIAEALGWSIDAMLSDNWTPTQHPHEGRAAAGMAHDLIHPQPEDELTTCTWEFILSAVISELPPRFSVAVPDDALSPITPRGTGFLFATSSTPPTDGTVVIIQAGNGRRYVRLFFAGAGDEWEARARDPAHRALHSVRDKLTLLASATHRAGGQG